jgi:hypothetical protein
MIDFYQQNKSDRFEFIAFHDAQAKSFEELDPKMEALKKEHWQGRDLPFPILLDASGATIRRYGVRVFPTQILIDPEGRLVGHGDIELLRSKLLGEGKATDPPTPRKVDR